jgi:hypothetical protein
VRQLRLGALAPRSMPTRRCPSDCAACNGACILSVSTESVPTVGDSLAQGEPQQLKTQRSSVRPPLVPSQDAPRSAARIGPQCTAPGPPSIACPPSPHILRSAARRVRMGTARVVHGRACTVDPAGSPPRTPPSRQLAPSILAPASPPRGGTRRDRSTRAPSERWEWVSADWSPTSAFRTITATVRTARTNTTAAQMPETGCPNHLMRTRPDSCRSIWETSLPS